MLVRSIPIQLRTFGSCLKQQVWHHFVTMKIEGFLMIPCWGANRSGYSESSDGRWIGVRLNTLNTPVFFIFRSSQLQPRITHLVPCLSHIFPYDPIVWWFSHWQNAQHVSIYIWVMFLYIFIQFTILCKEHVHFSLKWYIPWKWKYILMLFSHSLFHFSLAKAQHFSRPST